MPARHRLRKTEREMTPAKSSNACADEVQSAMGGGYVSALAPGEIHVWLKGSGGLRGETRQHPAEAVAANDASQHFLFTVLAYYSGSSIASLKIRRAPLGKPYLEGGPCFNLSHSAGATAIAISYEDVGIDIEHPRRQTSSRDLARKYFTFSENFLLSRCPDSQVGRLFLRHWVSKEAITKLEGVGIYRGLRHAETDHGISPPAARYRGRRVCLAECGEEVGMIGALASWQPAKVNVFVIGENSAIIE